MLSGEWLAAGTHVNAVGSNFLGKAEIDLAGAPPGDVIVVDSKEQARLEAGDSGSRGRRRLAGLGDIAELGSVVVGRSPGRQDGRDMTMFKSVGLAIEDVAAASGACLIGQHGVGREIDF